MKSNLVGVFMNNEKEGIPLGKKSRKTGTLNCF